MARKPVPAASPDAEYRYNGPPSGVSLPDREVLLHPGKTVRLPPDRPFVMTLVARGLLTEVPQLPLPLDESPKENT